MTAQIDWQGQRRQQCPECGRNDRDRTLGVRVDERGGVAHCFRCRYVETSAGEVRRPGQPPQAAAAQHEVLSDYGHELWRATRPLAGEALAYLQARQCVIPPADGHLRWHPALKHPPSGAVAPALVALVSDAITGQPLTLARTWVRADGRKAGLDPSRMNLGGHRKAGGVVRLWPDESVTQGLGLAEGVETALSLAHAFTPVWACLDAGNLATMPVLAGVESVLIAADHDLAGTAAAEACGARWVSAGREASIVMPDSPKTDINDLARAA